MKHQYESERRNSTAQTDWVDHVYREHCDEVFRVCMRFAAGDRQWALDRTQEVFIKLVERLDEIEQSDNPYGWLYRVAVNACLMELRRQRTVWRLWPRLRGDVATTAPETERQVVARRDLSALEQAFGNLPDKARAVMALVYLENKSQSEVAKLLSLSKGQVSKLHKKAIAILRTLDWEVDDA